MVEPKSESKKKTEQSPRTIMDSIYTVFKPVDECTGCSRQSYLREVELTQDKRTVRAIYTCEKNHQHVLIRSDRFVNWYREKVKGEKIVPPRQEKVTENNKNDVKLN